MIFDIGPNLGAVLVPFAWLGGVALIFGALAALGRNNRKDKTDA